MPRRTDDSLHRRPAPAPRHHGGAGSPVRHRPRQGDQGRRHGRGQERRSDRRAGRQPGRRDRRRPGQAGRRRDAAPGARTCSTRAGPRSRARRLAAAEGRTEPLVPGPGAALARRTAPARAPPDRPATCSSRPRARSRTSPPGCRTASPPSSSRRSAASPAASPACSCSARPPRASLAGRLTSGVKAVHSDDVVGRNSPAATRRRPTTSTPRRRLGLRHDDHRHHADGDHRPAAPRPARAPRCRRRRTARCRPPRASCPRPPPPAGTTRPARTGGVG